MEQFAWSFTQRSLDEIERVRLEDASRLQNEEIKEEYRQFSDVRAWLDATVDTADDHSLYKKVRESNPYSCKWIETKDAYHKWRDLDDLSSNPVLWLSGAIGSGMAPQ
jgi:hypothetical protein